MKTLLSTFLYSLITLMSLSSCAHAAAILQGAWYFDELEWTGVADEVKDSSGRGFHGQAMSPNKNSAEGVVCGAADLSADSNTDGIRLSSNVLNGADRFSISVWGKLPASGDLAQTILSGAYTTGWWPDWDNSLLMFFSTRTVASLYYAQNNFLLSSIPPVNDEQWHHYVWTHDGSQNCFYMDGQVQACRSSSADPVKLSDDALYIGQEQDAVNGRFSRYQDWEGWLDELLIFRSALTSSEVSSIYVNQLNQFNWDGSVRNCPVGTGPKLPSPLGEWHFDEEQWDGVADEIVDYSGNERHSEASKAMTTVEEGVVCRAADFTEDTLDDFVSLDYQAFQGLTEMSFSVWGKVGQWPHSQALLSGYGPQYNNELLLYFWDNQTFEPLLKKDTFSRQNTISNVNIVDNQWHHFTYTRNAGKNCFYVDGSLQGCRYGLDTRAFNFSPGGVILGHEQDTLQGSFDNNQDWEGYIDEPIVFGRELNAAQVRRIYINQLSKKNYDGSSRRCSIPEPVYDYRFDGCNWEDGLDVIDSSANGLDAYAKNGVLSTVDGKICGRAHFDSIDDYIDLPNNNYLNLTTHFTLTSWIKLESLPNHLSSVVSKDTNYEYHIDDNGYVYWWWEDSSGDAHSFTSSARVNLNQWHHIALTYTSGRQTIYLDGQPVGSKAFEGELMINTNSLQIGQDHDVAGRFFAGDVDEVKMFNMDLTSWEIQQLYKNESAGRNYDGSVRACNCSEPTDVDHYAISHNGSLVSCLSSEVTFSPRNDQQAIIDAGQHTITLNTSTNKGVWERVVQGNGTLINQGNGQATYHFAANETSVTLAFRYPDLPNGDETVNFDVTDGQVTDLRDSGVDDPDLLVSDVGLIFDIPDTPACTQTSSISMRVVKTSDDQQVCEAALSGPQTLTLLANYLSPASGNNALEVDVDGTNYQISNTSRALPVSFNANGEAVLKVRYRDAGKLRLDATVDINGKAIRGSDAFVAYPAQLALTANNAAGESLLGAVGTHTASKAFNLSVAAQCADGTITPNYQPDHAEMGIYMQAPTIAEGATGGAFVLGASLSVTDSPQWINVSNLFANGVMNQPNATYSEVGVLHALVRDSDYMGHVVSVSDALIGRFIPSYFSLSHNSPRWAGHCSTDQFVYQGNNIGFAVHPELTIHAHGANGAVTNNYSQAFWSLSAQAPNRSYTDRSSSSSILSSLLGVTDWQGTQQGFNGKGVLSLLNDTVSYSKVLGSAPFRVSVGLNFASSDLTDADGVCYRIDADGDGIVDSGCSAFEWPGAIEGPEARLGRLYLPNTYGSETSPLPLTWLTQYYDGAAFVTNTLDSCTVWSNNQVVLKDGDSRIITDNKTAIHFAYPAADFTVSAGDAGARLDAPGAGNIGSILMQVDLTTQPYLQFDWDGDGVDNTVVESEVVFGRYRGHDRILYQKQP